VFVSPETIVFAVRATVRLGRAARDAYEQTVRDGDLGISKLQLVPVPKALELHRKYRASFDGDRILWERLVAVLPAPPPDHPNHLWDRGFKSPAIEQAAEAVYRSWSLERPAAPPDSMATWTSQRVAEEGVQFVLAQWMPGHGPAHPAARIVLAFADVALDYVQINPSILGIGGDGEKIVAALARNLSGLFPDVDDANDWPPEAWPRYYFIERSAAILLHAGLKTVSENAALIVDETHYQDLTKRVLDPLVKLYDDNAASPPTLAAVRDTLLGPMARAAFAVLAEHQAAFFGPSLDPKNVAGLFAKAILEEFAANALPDVFSGDGAVRLYQAVLRAAAANPDILIGASDAENLVLARKLIAAVAGKLAAAPPPYGVGLAQEIAVVALETVAKHPPVVALLGGDWDVLAQRLIGNVADGLAQGLGAGGVEGALRRVFDVKQAVAFFQIFTDQVARTPGMIVGAKADTEVKALVATVSGALSANGANLLDGDAWLAIAAVAARAVAENPGRLLDMNLADPTQQLLAKVMQAVLRAAATDIEEMRTKNSLLFGNTLRAALEMTIGIAARRVDKLTDGGIAKVEEFIGKLNEFAAADPARMGAQEWLRVYERFLARLVEADDPAALVAGTLVTELIGAPN
jgi:hypothetical protein